MRSDAQKFAKERYFNGYSDTRSVQENFNLITSFVQDSADKHIPSKTSRSVSSVPWITPAIRRKIRRKNATHAKAKTSGSAKIRAKFETLRREIKADIRKQHDLYVNNVVGDVKANPKHFYRYINSQKKDAQGIPPMKKRNGGGVEMVVVLLNRNPRKQQNSMVSSLMYSLNPNTVRFLFWIDHRRLTFISTIYFIIFFFHFHLFCEHS